MPSGDKSKGFSVERMDSCCLKLWSDPIYFGKEPVFIKNLAGPLLRIRGENEGIYKKAAFVKTTINVEPAGVEPASKHVFHKLSSCLVNY